VVLKGVVGVGVCGWDLWFVVGLVCHWGLIGLGVVVGVD
jgi:hypothetical protein